MAGLGTARQRAQFLQAFAPQTAAVLRLDSIEALRTVLQGRFGSLPEAVEQRIAAADVDELDALASCAAIVASPDEL